MQRQSGGPSLGHLNTNSWSRFRRLSANSVYLNFHFFYNLRRRIRIWNQNQPITSGFWDIWGYVLEKWGVSLLLRLCTGRKNFFWFFSRMSSFSTTLFLRNELLNNHERFFFTKIRPYQVLTFIRTTLWAFRLTLWCIPFCIRKFILKICACRFWWSVNKNLQSENWNFHF